jgi:hypothetical protein
MKSFPAEVPLHKVKTMTQIMHFCKNSTNRTVKLGYDGGYLQIIEI